MSLGIGDGLLADPFRRSAKVQSSKRRATENRRPAALSRPHFVGVRDPKSYRRYDQRPMTTQSATTASSCSASSDQEGKEDEQDERPELSRGQAEAAHRQAEYELRGAVLARGGRDQGRHHQHEHRRSPADLVRVRIERRRRAAGGGVVADPTLRLCAKNARAVRGVTGVQRHNNSVPTIVQGHLGCW